MPASNAHCSCETQRHYLCEATVLGKTAGGSPPSTLPSIASLPQHDRRAGRRRGHRSIATIRAGFVALCGKRRTGNRKRKEIGKGRRKSSGRTIEEREKNLSMRLCAGRTQTTPHRRASLLSPFRSENDSFTTRSSQRANQPQGFPFAGNVLASMLLSRANGFRFSVGPRRSGESVRTIGKAVARNAKRLVCEWSLLSPPSVLHGYISFSTSASRKAPSATTVVGSSPSRLNRTRRRRGARSAGVGSPIGKILLIEGFWIKWVGGGRAAGLGANV